MLSNCYYLPFKGRNLNAAIEKIEYSKALSQMEKRANEYMVNMAEVNLKQITPKFLDILRIRNLGNSIKMPNCLMLACGGKDVNEALAQWTKDNSECRIVTIEKRDDILDALEKAEESHQKDGDWTLLHVKDFAELINPKLAEFETIEAAKDLMSAASEDFHTTILFTAENPEELDDIALQPHRVKSITANFKSDREMNIEDAWNRLLSDKPRCELLEGFYQLSSKAKTYPISTMKDLLLVTGLDQKGYSIDFNATEEEISKMYLVVQDHLFSMIKTELSNLKYEDLYLDLPVRKTSVQIRPLNNVLPEDATIQSLSFHYGYDMLHSQEYSDEDFIRYSEEKSLRLVKNAFTSDNEFLIVKSLDKEASSQINKKLLAEYVEFYGKSLQDCMYSAKYSPHYVDEFSKKAAEFQQSIESKIPNLSTVALAHFFFISDPELDVCKHFNKRFLLNDMYGVNNRDYYKVVIPYNEKYLPLGVLALTSKFKSFEDIAKLSTALGNFKYAREHNCSGISPLRHWEMYY